MTLNGKWKMKMETNLVAANKKNAVIKNKLKKKSKLDAVIKNEIRFLKLK